MQRVYVVHYHELALKGKNRPMFLRALQDNICRATGLEKALVKIATGRLIVHHQSGDGDKIVRGLSSTFGIASLSPAILIAADVAAIQEALLTFILDSMKVSANARWGSFAVRVTRGDKKFPVTSKELEVQLGDLVRKRFSWTVDLENPAVTFYVEIFSAKGGPGGAVVYTEKISGPGGLPVGTQGRVAVMLSGGIDSPVAAYRLMKRGAAVVGVHFHSYPFTSRASIDKVKEIAGVLTRYSGAMKLYLVPLAEAQKAVVQNCSERYRVLLYRRLMVRITEELARRERAQALITGESLGQVASQTLENIGVTDQAAAMPIFRPLVGYDKAEIITEARKIGTYEISILPHDDCCTLMMPKNPVTRARIGDIENEEKKLDLPALVSDALKQTELWPCSIS